MFSNSRNLDYGIVAIYLQITIWHRVELWKYLGISIDDKPTFKTHTDTLITKFETETSFSF